MQKSRGGSHRLCATIGVVAVLSVSAFARVPYPVASSYADTVRVGVLCNCYAAGTCTMFDMPMVGPQTQDFVIGALDTSHVRNVRVVFAPTATEDTIMAMFPGKLPHVIVHVNAGWGGAGGLALPNVLVWAAAHNIGIVEVGDDDAFILDSMFNWINLDLSKWSPMSEATWLKNPGDSLFIKLQPGSDATLDSAAYPHLNGVVRNAGKRILTDSTLHFRPYDYTPDGRCEADPDVYTFVTGTEIRALSLGYQQGYNAACDTTTLPRDNTCSTTVGLPGEYKCITIFRDTILIGDTPGERRAVALSFQPQFLRDTIAAQQIVYDAVMYASLVHIGNPAGIRNRDMGRSGLASQRSSDTRVRVTDATGRTVWHGGVDAFYRLRQDATRWRPGVYIMTSSTLDAVKAYSFVISR